MRRVAKITHEIPFILNCEFDNGEIRSLDLEKVLDKNQKFVNKIFEESIFKQAKLGIFGEIYWDGIAEIRQLDGSIKACNYDISPEFAYSHSEPLK